MLALEKIYAPVWNELEQVRAIVAERWTEALQLVYGAEAKPPETGGKLLRPALCLISAGAAGAQRLDHFVNLASGMEMLHVAALVHDDVVDGSDTRRGQRSLKAQWDNRTAVLGGDYIMARAIVMMGSYNSCGVIINAVESICQMASGELRNFGTRHHEPTPEQCIDLARGKTGSLFAVTCSTPVLLIDEGYREVMERYGMALGVAFQLIDDVLDLCQPETALGKPSCGDIVEGKRTLPILYLRDGLDQPDRARLLAMEGAEISEDDREWVASAMEATGAREHTETLARQYAAEARAALEELPASPYRDSMANLADFVLARGA